MTENECDLCGERRDSGLLTRMRIGQEWVWVCLDCREDP